MHPNYILLFKIQSIMEDKSKRMFCIVIFSTTTATDLWTLSKNFQHDMNIYVERIATCKDTAKICRWPFCG